MERIVKKTPIAQLTMNKKNHCIAPKFFPWLCNIFPFSLPSFYLTHQRMLQLSDRCQKPNGRAEICLLDKFYPQKLCQEARISNRPKEQLGISCACINMCGGRESMMHLSQFNVYVFCIVILLCWVHWFLFIEQKVYENEIETLTLENGKKCTYFVSRRH